MHKVGIIFACGVAAALIFGAYVLRTGEHASLERDFSDAAVPTLKEAGEEHWVDAQDDTHVLSLYPDTVFREYKNGTQLWYGLWESELLFGGDDGALGRVILVSATEEVGVRRKDSFLMVDVAPETMTLKNEKTGEETSYRLKSR